MSEITPQESVSNNNSEVGYSEVSEVISERTDDTVKRQQKRQKSIVWDHFTVSETNPKKAICNHCPDTRISLPIQMVEPKI
jgi:hypothetical protein